MEDKNKSLQITIDVTPVESEHYTHSIRLQFKQEGFLQDNPVGQVFDSVNGLDNLEAELKSCLEVMFCGLKPGIKIAYDGTKHEVK